MTQPLEPGDRILGKYEVERVLGTGGMGTVYAATDEQLHRTIAVKLLRKAFHDDQGRRLALREARAAVQLRSEHVARVLDAGLDGESTPYIVMEFLEGEDLRARIEATSIQVDEAVGFIVQACEAITEAHAAGIVHRDLKPDNLFITHGVGGLPHVKVLDFGIAKIVRSDGQHITSGKGGEYGILGSPPYTAPERLRDVTSVDRRSDIWSLGIVLYEALTGTRPFVGENIPELLLSILDSTPRPVRSLRADVPEAVDAAVCCCLEKNPDARFQSAALLSEALLPFAPDWAQAAGQRTLLMVGRGRRESSGASSAEMRALTTATETTHLHGRAPSRRWQQLPLVAAAAIVGAIGAVGLLWHDRPRAQEMPLPSAVADPPPAPTGPVAEEFAATGSETAAATPIALAAPRLHVRTPRSVHAKASKTEIDPLRGRK